MCVRVRCPAIDHACLILARLLYSTTANVLLCKRSGDIIQHTHSGYRNETGQRRESQMKNSNISRPTSDIARGSPPIFMAEWGRSRKRKYAKQYSREWRENLAREKSTRAIKKTEATRSTVIFRRKTVPIRRKDVSNPQTTKRLIKSIKIYKTENVRKFLYKSCYDPICEYVHIKLNVCSKLFYSTS